jgi:hypothetical protein
MTQRWRSSTPASPCGGAVFCCNREKVTLRPTENLIWSLGLNKT